MSNECNTLNTVVGIYASMPEMPDLDNNTVMTELVECVEELNRRLSALEDSKIKLSPPLKVGKSGNALTLNISKICNELGLEYGDYVKIHIVKVD